jgi:ketosteroid isomerase-like protein
MPTRAAYGEIILEMASENVEIVRRMYEEFNRGQSAPLWALDESIEWHTRSDLPDSDVHRGHEGVIALVLEWVGAFDEFSAEIEELIDRGDYVVVPLILSGRIVGSEEITRMSETHVLKVRDGKVIGIREYRTRELALEALESAG